jgi:post-segregation antitoxin (ccd killing protein)
VYWSEIAGPPQYLYLIAKQRKTAVAPLQCTVDVDLNINLYNLDLNASTLT